MSEQTTAGERNYTITIGNEICPLCNGTRSDHMTCLVTAVLDLRKELQEIKNYLARLMRHTRRGVPDDWQLMT